MRVVSAAAALALGLVAAVGLVLGLGGTAQAADPPPARADIAAEALRQDPVYISPHLDPGAVGPRDAERIEAAAQELKAVGIPVYVSVSPVWEGDGTGEFGVAYLALLHDRLGKDGAYVHVDPDRRVRIRAYGVRPPGGALSVENRLLSWTTDDNASLADIAVVALNGLRTGEVPHGQGDMGDDMAYRVPEHRAEKATLAVGLAGAVAVALLGLLHRFTDLPLWPGRRRSPADDAPEVDWHSAPDLPDHAYGTLYELALRRRNALNAALNTASPAGLPFEGSLADTAADLADDLLICCIPPDVGTGNEQGREFVEAIDLPDIVASIEISRIGIRALAAMRDGVPFQLQPPCFYNPLHERGEERTPHPGEETDPVDVAVCPACAAHGPDPLLVWSEDGMEPYYASDYANPVWRTTGYGAAVLDRDAEVLLRVLGTWVDADVEADEESNA
jgi:hypothetical protein